MTKNVRQNGCGRKNVRPHYIVKLPKKGGVGVLVGEVVLTAAHCLTFSTNGEMVLGDYFIEAVQTSQGQLKARPLAVEPCSDVAVLGALDGQVFFNEAAAFKRFCETTTPVPLARGRPKLCEAGGYE